MKPRSYGPFPYSPIIDRPRLEWPGGAHVALKHPLRERLIVEAFHPTAPFRLRCRVHRRSSMIAAAVIEQRMIGHISGPPARTISHIQVTPSC